MSNHKLTKRFRMQIYNCFLELHFLQLNIFIFPQQFHNEYSVSQLTIKKIIANLSLQ